LENGCLADGEGRWFADARWDRRRRRRHRTLPFGAGDAQGDGGGAVVTHAVDHRIGQHLFQREDVSAGALDGVRSGHISGHIAQRVGVDAKGQAFDGVAPAHANDHLDRQRGRALHHHRAVAALEQLGGAATVG